jgi:hypothetical protein
MSSFYDRIVSNIYKDTKSSGMRIKSDFNCNVDPILQRGNRYEDKIPKKTYTQNYLERSKVNPVQKPMKKPFLQQSQNIFQEHNPEPEKHKRKIFPEMMKRKCPDMKIPSVKIYPYKLQSQLVKNILTGKDQLNDYSSEFKGIKINPGLKSPSAAIKEQNDKKLLMPCEYEQMYGKKFKRTKSTHLMKTSDRLFTSGNFDTFEDTENFNSLNRKTKSKEKMHYPGEVDHMGDLIGYKYALKFRSEVNNLIFMKILKILEFNKKTYRKKFPNLLYN